MVEYCHIEKKIYFFNRPGIAIQIDTSSDFILAACKLMDGEKTVDELKSLLMLKFPLEAPFLNDLLTVLDNEYLLEDRACNYPTNLSEYEISRWSRNIEFFSANCKANVNKYSFQEKLKNTKVAIFGLGGVGSNILYNLAAMGVTNFKLIDFDSVELSNLNRQIIYQESNVGQLKTDAAKNRVLSFLPNATVEVINKKINSSEEIEEIITAQGIVIAAIDHPREHIMNWFNQACVKKQIPFLCGALDSKISIIYTVYPGKTGCIECWKHSVPASNFLFQDLIQNENFVAAASPNVAIMPFLSIISGLIASEILKIVTGIAEAQSLGNLCTFDFATTQIKIAESWKKNPDCLVC